VPGHVEDAGGQVLGGDEALVEEAALLELPDEVGGDRLARLVMLGVDGQELGLETQCSMICEGSSTESRATVRLR